MVKKKAAASAGQIRIEYVDPKALLLADYNPRVLPDAAKERLYAGLDAHGFVEPVVARREDRLVIGGHQRTGYALDRNLPTVPVVFLEGVSDERAKALNVLLNNPNAQGGWDFAKLATVLHDITGSGLDVTFSGFSADEARVIGEWASNGSTNSGSADGIPVEFRGGGDKIVVIVMNLQASNDVAIAIRKLLEANPSWQASIDA